MFTLPQKIDSRPILITGAGTLGRRIALMFATQSAEIRLYDLDETTRNEAVKYVNDTLPSILDTPIEKHQYSVTVQDNLENAVKDCWLIMECIPERRDIKIDLFAQLESIAPADAILASNSSSYPSSQLIDKVKDPSRVLNVHFFMPPKVRALELMSSGKTQPEIIDLLAKTFPRYSLTPYVAQQESTGFIFNRIWAAIKREALMVVAEGVSTPEDVDGLFKQCTGSPNGPFHLMDSVGLDVVLDIEEHYAKEDPNISELPRQLLREKVKQGHLGVKSGQGFYKY